MSFSGIKYPSGGGSGDSFWTASGDEIYNNNPGNVGVGTLFPSTKFQVGDATAPQTASFYGDDSNFSFFTLHTTLTNQRILSVSNAVGSESFIFDENNLGYKIGMGIVPDTNYGLTIRSATAGNNSALKLVANNGTTQMTLGYGKIAYPGSLEVEGLGGIQFLGLSSGVKMTMTNGGLFFFGGATAPTAFAHLAAGTLTTPAFKFTSGLLLTTPQAGAMEWNGTNLFITQTSGLTRQTIAYRSDLASDLVFYLGAGTYVPILTNTTNLDASTAHEFQYSWVVDPNTGLKVVTVSGYVEANPTAPGNTRLTISIPIPTSFSNIQECGGTANSTTIAGQGAGIRAVVSSGDVMMEWTAVDVTNQPMFLTFTYKVTPP